MEEKNEYKSAEKINGITEGVIWKQLLLFFYPLLFGSFFQQLYNTVDAIIVGQFVGKEALSAVGGTTGSLINLFIGFFVGLSSGATVIISQYYGGKKEKEVEKAVHSAIALALAAGAVIMVVGIIGAPTALIAMKTPKDLLPYSVLFIRIYFLGTIPNLFYNIGAGILRAIGDSKRPLYFLIASVFINVLLDFIFVIGFKLGVAGVGIATVISQIFSAVLVCRALIKTTGSYRLSLRKIRFHSEILRRIIHIGLPAGLQSLMYSISNVVIQSNINRFGTDTIAAWTAYGKIDGLFWMTMGAFGISITTFVGQNYGAGKSDRVRKGVRQCLFLAITISVLLSTVLYSFGIYVLQLFTKDAAVMSKGLDIIHFMIPAYFTYVCVEILSGALRGMGNSLIPMILTCFGICILRIVWVFVVIPLQADFKTVITCYPLTWACTSILFIIYYLFYIKRKRL